MQLESDDLTYDDKLEKGCKPNGDGLFGDCVGEYVSEVQPDIRPLHREVATEKEELYESGLEYAAAIAPDIIRLEEKDVVHRTYKKVLALAGVASTNQKTTFDMIEETISEMRKQAQNLLCQAKKLDDQLIYLKNLAVLDN
jgi:hypothetical protein